MPHLFLFLATIAFASNFDSLHYWGSSWREYSSHLNVHVCERRPKGDGDEIRILALDDLAQVYIVGKDFEEAIEWLGSKLVFAVVAVCSMNGAKPKYGTGNWREQCKVFRTLKTTTRIVISPRGDGLESARANFLSETTAQDFHLSRANTSSVPALLNCAGGPRFWKVVVNVQLSAYQRTIYRKVLESHAQILVNKPSAMAESTSKSNRKALRFLVRDLLGVCNHPSFQGG